MSDKKKTPSRTRNFATVVYLESVKENWLDILEEEKRHGLTGRTAMRLAV